MRTYHLLLLVLIFLSTFPSASHAQPRVEENLQYFLDQQPGPLKSYREGHLTAAQLITSTSGYYGMSPRILLALGEATNGLLSMPDAPEAALRKPFSPLGPDGFAAQLDWAARELRAGLGPYDQAPTLTFTDGTTITLTLQQAAEGVAVQRFLAPGRSQNEWRAIVERFGAAFITYFNNELPQTQPAITSGFLRRPWAVGTRVEHLAYFDHAYPTVDSGKRGNGIVLDYLGRSNVQYDGHDGHDYVFPDKPIGTFIYAAADGIAYASTHRGNGDM
jgi:murein DD-endopeptidase MepM/ murein hydrolase activator NlpD